MLETLKAQSLQARKDRDTVKANLLSTVLSDVQVRAKDDGNRSPTDKDAQKVVEKFLKQNALAIEARSTEQLLREKEILEALAALKPVVEIDYEGILLEVISNNPDKWAAVQTNPKGLGFFVGQVMKATGGLGDPVAVQQKLAQIAVAG